MFEPMEFRLPETLLESLRRLGDELRAPSLFGVRPQRVEAVLREVDALPASAVVRAEQEFAWAMGMFHYQDPGTAWWRPRQLGADLLRRYPALAPLFLFHRDGRQREAALRLLDGPARSAFVFASIAQRLNDWAEPVRRAAQACAARVFPVTDAAVCAEAAMFLLEQQRRWSRWEEMDTSALDLAFARSEVAENLVRTLIAARSGPMAALLRSMLRTPVFDAWLEDIAQQAFLPAVRGIALQAMIVGPRWPSRIEKKWIDKSMGRYRLVWVYAQRATEGGMTREAAALQAARDRSAAVRRLAVIALLSPGQPLANFDAVAEVLKDDRNTALRERTAFAARRRAEPA
jgi:hypothetical protein